MASKYVFGRLGIKRTATVILSSLNAETSPVLGQVLFRSFQTSSSQANLYSRPKISILGPQIRCYSAVSNSGNTIDVHSYHGLPVFLIPLPSRHELCQFILKPLSNNLGDLIRFLQEEDHGIDRVAAYNQEGQRIAKSTSIDVLLKSDFTLQINDSQYLVQVQEPFLTANEKATELGQVKDQIAKLYSALQIEEHQMEKEKAVLERLENIKLQLKPMEDVRIQLEEKGRKRTNMLAWTGLGLMGFQFGLLARLTWFEYSWDIMEPVTYFVTYGTCMAMFAYYVLTKQEYNFEAVRDREHLITVHKLAKKHNLDLTYYNQLRDQLAQAEQDLKRLRDPLQLQLPIQQLELKQKELEA